MPSPKPTFPAYSEAEIAKASASKIIRPVSGLNGVTVELVYPEEDLSLVRVFPVIFHCIGGVNGCQAQVSGNA